MDEGHAAGSAQVSGSDAEAQWQRRGLIPLVVGALAVLAVIGAAAHAGVRLSDRGPLADQRGPLIAIAVIFFLLDTFIIMLIRRAMLRRREERDIDVRPPERDVEPEPWWVTVITYVLFLALILLPAALLYLVLRDRDAEQRADDRQPTVGVPNLELSQESISDFVYLLFLGLSALAILIAITVTYLQLRTRRRTRFPFGVGPGGGESEIDEAAFVSAVEAGESAMQRVAHPREAIIACYVAMESTLAAHGSPRRAADTPSDLLDRAAAAGLVRSAACRTLTELFREARFSPHPMVAADVAAATAALAQLRTDLGARV